VQESENSIVQTIDYKMLNPYDPNTVNINLFYGRDALLSELLSGLSGSPRYSFGIAGGRRMGKTTLLRRVEQDLRIGIEQWRAGGLLVIPIYVDGVTLPKPLHSCDIWGYLLGELQNAISDQPFQIVGSPEFSDFKQIITPVLSNLSERPRIIVIFDEIEPIVACEWSDVFFNHWRALLGHTPNISEYFTSVFAGAYDMQALRREITSPLRDILEWRSLRTFDYEGACQLMQEPIDMEWPEPFLQRSYTETGGHTMLMQYIMQQVCMNEPEMAMESLEKAVKKFLRERAWQFAQWWERYCTPTAQRIYRRLYDEKGEVSLYSLVREFGLSETNGAIDILQHVGIATINENEEIVSGCRLQGEMFQRWYQAYGTLADSPQHDPEIYSRLSKISLETANKYLSAWKIYQSDMPNYSGALVEVRGVLEHLLDTFAPSEKVQSEPGFKFETDRRDATLRQRIRYYVRTLYSPERTKEIVSDYNLLEIAIEQIVSLTTMAHRSTSGMAHETATHDIAYRALKQWDSILAQLLPAV
jgi:hypothetical protein